MNTYKIAYQFLGSSYEDAVVTAPDQRAAVKAFKASFKGTGLKVPDVFNVELVAENTPATKDQEREALEKIKAILDTLGPDSYVGTAFEGCLEIAEENIENDFACSMKQRVEAVVVENTRLKEKVKELEDKLAESEKDYEAAHATAHLVVDEKDAEIANLKAQVASLTEIGRWNAEQCDEARCEAGELRQRAEKAEAEVVRLKAKLYDYMTAGA
jgi:hypothetical protein